MTREQYLTMVRPRAREYVLTYLGEVGFQGGLDNIINQWVDYWDMQFNLHVLRDKNGQIVKIW